MVHLTQLHVLHRVYGSPFRAAKYENSICTCNLRGINDSFNNEYAISLVPVEWFYSSFENIISLLNKLSLFTFPNIIILMLFSLFFISISGLIHFPSNTVFGAVFSLYAECDLCANLKMHVLFTLSAPL